jgi:hypothetical protein
MSTSVPSQETAPPAWVDGLTWAAAAAALAVSAGSVALTLHLNLVACPLCFYQRCFVFATAALLVLGLGSGVNRAVSLSALALPTAVAAFAVACFHVSLVARGDLECPAGLSGRFDAPTEALVGIGVMTALVLVDALAHLLQKRANLVAVAGGLSLGVILAVGVIKTGPDLKAPPAPYPPEKPFDICRAVYKPPQ